MKVRRVGIKTHVRLDLDGVAIRPPDASGHAKSTNQSSANIASRLPEELVEEILLRLPPDEPAHLFHATVVSKAWHSILSGNTFRRRYLRFHGTPPLQGYFCNNVRDSTVLFLPTTTSVVAAASPVCCAPMLDDHSSGQNLKALDCRHGRVLIEVEAGDNRRLIVWDPIAGSQQHLSLPTFLQDLWYDYAGAVLCAKDGCDHIDCHRGPFLIVFVWTRNLQTWTSMYSSDTGVWSSPTTLNDKPNQYIDDTRPGMLIGDGLYYTTVGYNIVKYDLRKHELSVMPLPVRRQSIIIEVNDGGLGVASRLNNCIYIWSWQVDSEGVGGWVNDDRDDVELDDMMVSKGDLFCMAEGTNTVFIGSDHTGIFTLDLRSRKVTKRGEPATYSYWPILPYMSFSTPKY